MKRIVSVLCVCFLVSGSAIAAEGGADALLNKVDPKRQSAKDANLQKTVNDSALAQMSGLELDNPFLMQLFVEARSQNKISFDLNAWFQKVFKKDYEHAAHLWTVVEKQAPSDLRNTLKATRLYLMWQLGLKQTFVDLWVQSIRNQDFLNSRIMLSLDEVVSPEFDKWLINEAITVLPEYVSVLKSMPPSKNKVTLDLQAWAMQRSGLAALPYLKAIPETNSFRIPLSQTVALAYARQNNLAAAGTVLKNFLEPVVQKLEDPNLLANHYLNVARLLYQIGEMDGAEKYYEKVPNGSPDYLTAREELVWVLLRKGELPKLRGQIETLTNSVFEERFAPEAFLVRAISNLKLCYYDRVEEDFADFLRVNKKWATSIQAALKSTTLTKPWRLDRFAEISDKAISKRADEAKRLSDLGEASIKAALPAVGVQSHWASAKQRMEKVFEQARKDQSSDYRRIWKNQHYSLLEAVRKMKFVKVEFMTQVHQLAKAVAEEQGKPLAQQDFVSTTLAASAQPESGELSFVYDGVVWPDEFFNLRSAAQTRCMKWQ